MSLCGLAISGPNGAPRGNSDPHPRPAKFRGPARLSPREEIWPRTRPERGGSPRGPENIGPVANLNI